MKPEMQMALPGRRYLREERSVRTAALSHTTSCLQSGFDPSRGYSSPYDGESRRFYNLSRQFLEESAREQKRELFVLGLIVLACAWPIISMFIAVAHVYSVRLP
jgi:hypothetical protein